MSVAFNNVGTVNVDSGLLNLSGGGTSTGGVFDVDAGATLYFGGSHTLDTSSSLSGAGDVEFFSGTTAIDGAYNVTGTTTVSGGTANFNVAATAGSLALSGGMLRSLRAIHSRSTISLTGRVARCRAPATTTVTGTLTISGGNNKYLGEYGNNGHTLINNGTANFSGGTLYMVRQWHGRSRREHHQQRHLPRHRRRRHPPVLLLYGGNQPSFTNNGTFTKSGAGTATEMSVAFNNVGTVNVDSGLLFLNGTLNNLSAGTLTGGVYRVVDIGSGAALAVVRLDGHHHCFHGRTLGRQLDADF